MSEPQKTPGVRISASAAARGGVTITLSVSPSTLRVLLRCECGNMWESALFFVNLQYSDKGEGPYFTVITNDNDIMNLYFHGLPSKGYKYAQMLSCVRLCVQLFETPWTVAQQAPLSMGFFRQEY